MDPLPKLEYRPEVFTAPFLYVRLQGNHRQMDVMVKKARQEATRQADWESLIVDRSEPMKQWIPPIRTAVEKRVPAYIYFNNHYAGYASGSVKLFSRLHHESLD